MFCRKDIYLVSYREVIQVISANVMSQHSSLAIPKVIKAGNIRRNKKKRPGQEADLPFSDGSNADSYDT